MSVKIKQLRCAKAIDETFIELSIRWLPQAVL